MTPGQGDGPIDGSRLCLACGLCCQGLLHDRARLRDDEVEEAQRLGLHSAEQGETAFSLPCPCHREGRCTVYAERLSPCREYRCKLLRGYLAGQVAWAEGLRRVEQAKRLVAGLQRRIGAPEAGTGIWQQLRALGAGTDPEMRMDAAALLTHCQRHFWTRTAPKKTMGP